MFEGKLVFAAGNFGDFDIFLYDFSSNQLKQLTSDDAWNDYPRFSPDGGKIAFGSTRSGKQEIWMMNADGSGANGTIEITETIEAQFIGSNWHGIFRTIPVEYTTPQGLNYTLFLEPLSVKDDTGHPTNRRTMCKIS